MKTRNLFVVVFLLWASSVSIAQTAEQFYKLGAAETQEQNHEAAIEYYSKSIALNPKFTAAYFARGYGRREIGDLAGAIADYTKVIELEPKNSSAYVNRGIVRDENGDPKGAYADLTKAIEIDPKDRDAYIERGRLRPTTDDLGAVADFTRAIEIDPTDRGAYQLRGMAYRRLGKVALALADEKKVYELLRP